jgi:uncharacterized Fe-S center protein
MGEKNRLSKVFFLKNVNKINKALNFFNIENFKDKHVPIKLHMGEKQNKYFIQPNLVKLLVNNLIKINAYPFLYDTTVAYQGLRHTKSGYEKLANYHGFSRDSIGCDITIDDSGIKTIVDNRDYIVAEQFKKSSHILCLSHVKGHIATGMGGAIKNLGMGGVVKETKINMHHGSRPIFNKDSCNYCGICSEVCPFNALKVSKGNWENNLSSCFGCGVCIENCNNNAISYVDIDLQYSIACAALACVKNKNVLYVNEVKRIARSCDCDPNAGPIICPDIGYLVSNDPVAIDKASLDLINNVKKDIFIEENKVNPLKQILYGEEIGLGNIDYELVKI